MTATAGAPKVGFYGRHVFPRLMDKVLDTKETRRIRGEVCAGLSGEVLEIGFGTGHNLPFLPVAVTRLLAVDPMSTGPQLAAKRLAASPVEVAFVGLDGQDLDLPDASVDAALSTWTLCSIPDAVAAVREVRRVLRPGGALHFVEHGLSPDEGVARWQHRCNGIQNRFACGCNLQREIPAIIAEGGMVVEDLDVFYAKGDPKVFGWTFQGRAVAA
jgi:SAM-dependent methyltransferase